VHVDLPKQRHKEMVAMSEPKPVAFLVAAESDRPRSRSLLGTGLRPSDAGSWKWSDLNTIAEPQKRTAGGKAHMAAGASTTKTKRGGARSYLPAGHDPTSHRYAAPYSEFDLMFPTTLGEALR